MSDFFKETEKNLTAELIQTGKTRIQIKGFKSLYARFNGKRTALKYELRFKYNGKLNTKTYKSSNLGAVMPDYSLDREYLERGDDPNKIAREKRLKAIEEHNQNKKKGVTLSEVYKEWKGEVIQKGNAWGDKPPREQKRRFDRFNRHVISKLGNRPIRSISQYELFTLFSPLYIDHFDTAGKCLSYLRRLFNDYSFKTGNEFTSPINDALKAQLKPSIEIGKEKRAHYSAPNFKALPALLTRLLRYDTLTSTIITACIFSGCRSKPIRLLKWKDVHMNSTPNGYFIIPIENNKDKKASEEERTVYFGGSFKQILIQQKQEQEANGYTTPFVFPNINKKKNSYEGFKPIDENAINRFMRLTFHRNELKEGYLWGDERLKSDLINEHATARSCFQTWALTETDKEQNGTLKKYELELTEACLLHNNKDIYRGAYRRDKIDPRKIYQIKDEWERFLLSYEWAVDEMSRPNAFQTIESETKARLVSYKIAGDTALRQAEQDFNDFGGKEILADLEKEFHKTHKKKSKA